MALGRVTVGFWVSAAVVPTSSEPMNAKIAIWKAPRKPKTPLGKNPPCSHRLAICA